MSEEKSLIDQQEIERIQRQLASGSNERVDTFSMMPSVSVSNASQDPEKPGEFAPGTIIMSVKTDQGYENSEMHRPFRGVVLRTRMFLRTKFAAKEAGVPEFVSDEFDSYADSEIITVKQKNADGKWEENFSGNYKEVTEHYSEASKFGKTNKYLDLQYNLYVCTSLDDKTIVKIVAKGKSRSALFDFMKTFTRRQGDFMTATWTIFNSAEHLKDYNGKPFKFPVWAFDFKKDGPLDITELKKALKLQEELNGAIKMRDAAFGKKEKREYAEVVATQSHAELPQGEPEDDVPTIQIEEPEGFSEPKKEELPKDANGNEVPFN